MKLFDFQTHEEACLNHSDMVCKHRPGRFKEISCVPIRGDPKRSKLHREIIRQPLQVLNSKVAVPHMQRGNAMRFLAWHSLPQLSVWAAEGPWLEFWKPEEKNRPWKDNIFGLGAGEQRMLGEQASVCVLTSCSPHPHAACEHSAWQARANVQGFLGRGGCQAPLLSPQGFQSTLLAHPWEKRLLSGGQAASVIRLGYLFLLLWFTSR